MTEPAALESATDVLVVGAGIAGLVTANRALELGLRATVLEADTDPRHRCASRLSGGIFHVNLKSITRPREELFELLRDATEGYGDPALARAIAWNAERSVRWLKEIGVSFTCMKPDEEGWLDNVLAPLGFQNHTRMVWEDLGSDLMMQRLEARLAETGGRLLRGERAVSLLMEGGVCRGVRAEGADGVARTCPAHAVVLADGSFHGNLDLLRAHVTQRPEQLKFRGPTTGRGDGLLMAEAAGAELLGMAYFYGHLLSADALHNEDLTLFPFLDSLASAGVIVGSDGRRFADEGRGGRYLTNAVAKLPDGLATVIFDDAIWNRAGKHFFSPPNPNLVINGGVLHTACDLGVLAAKAGLPADALQETVEAYNAAFASETLDRLEPERTAKKLRAEPVATPPFYAAPACAAITHAFGGVAVDDRARVLRRDRTPIAGLYAAGAICGGIDGGPDATYVGGLITGAVFGLIAAEDCASVGP